MSKFLTYSCLIAGPYTTLAKSASCTLTAVTSVETSVVTFYLYILIISVLKTTRINCFFLRKMHSQTLKTAINYIPLSRAAEGSTSCCLIALKPYCLYCFIVTADSCRNICCYLCIKYKIIGFIKIDTMSFLALQGFNWKHPKSSYTYFNKRASVRLDAFWRIKDSKQPVANNIHEDWKAV